MAKGQPSGSVDFTDLGIGALKADFAKLVETQITVGYQGESGEARHPGTNGESVAAVAAWMEYGTANAPARPALGVTMEAEREALRAAMKRGISAVIDRRGTLEEALRGIGLAAVEAVRRTIERSREWAEPLAASTVRAKGHDQPWVDTGTLRSEVSFSIRRGGAVIDHGGEE